MIKGEPRRVVLMGHRGVGKSSLIERIKTYLPEARSICLDAQIEQHLGRSIKNYFETEGEAQFRALEVEQFEKIHKESMNSEKDHYVALGAGFSGRIPTDWSCLWVRRRVSLNDFYFSNRPSLNQGELKMDPALYKERESHYAKLAQEELLLREAIPQETQSEASFFQRSVRTEGVITAGTSSYQLNETYLAQRRRWGLWFEGRDDRLNFEELSLLQPEVLSFRRKDKVAQTMTLAPSAQWVDWDLSLGERPEALEGLNVYESLHSLENEFHEHLQTLRQRTSGVSIKWAPLVSDWKQLQEGHLWQQESPATRFFLPQSPEGRWRWYRLLKPRGLFYFLTEGSGSSPDQPSLLETLDGVEGAGFAAILGDPVEHSWTPTYHLNYFKKKQLNTFAIRLTEKELTEETLSFLKILGMRAAAVTSPLKKKMAQLVQSGWPAVNTIWLDPSNKESWAMTDHEGAKSFFKEEQNTSVVIWGGGGTLDILQKALPRGVLYSHRSGKPREGFAPIKSPEVLVWAVSKEGWNQHSVFPSFSVKKVYDLSYTQDSPAIAYAARVGAEYVSGRGFFEAQAQEQQNHWSAL